MNTNVMNTPSPIIIATLLSLFVFSCKEKTVLDSKEYPNKKDRIKIVSENVILASKIYDTEFKLFNVNGFTNTRNLDVPGASSWHYELVVKIDSNDISPWLQGFIEIKHLNSDWSWANQLNKTRKENWESTSKPLFYKRPNEEVYIILYKKEGILYKLINNT